MTIIHVTKTDTGEYIVGASTQARVHYDESLHGWAVRWTGQPEAWQRVRVCGTKQSALGLAVQQLIGEIDDDG